MSTTSAKVAIAETEPSFEWPSYDEDKLALRFGLPLASPARLPRRVSLDPLLVQGPGAATRTRSKKTRRQATVAADPLATSLAIAARDHYERANNYYLSKKHSLDYIPLNSARRSSQFQCDLFRAFVFGKYYGGPAKPAANRPGQSSHEFGYAIDVRLAADKSRIQAALRYANWNDAYKEEQWHYEASSANGYSSIGTVKAELASTSLAVANLVGSWFERRKEALDIKDAYERERKRLEPRRKALSDTRARLSQENRALQRRKGELDAEARELQRLTDEVRRLKQKHDSVIFRCPNGQPWDSCTHQDLKDAYIRERDTYRRQYESIERERSRRQRDWSNARSEYQSDLQDYKSREAQYQRDVADFDRDAKRMTELQEDFHKKQEAMELILDQQAKHLATIQRRIDAFASSYRKRQLKKPSR